MLRTTRRALVASCLNVCLDESWLISDLGPEHVLSICLVGFFTGLVANFLFGSRTCLVHLGPDPAMELGLELRLELWARARARVRARARARIRVLT